MEETFWRIALGVGGLGVVAAFVFYSLYRKWLTIGVFSKLTSRQTFNIFAIFLFLTFLALLSLLYAFLVSGSGHKEPVLSGKGLVHVRTSISRTDKDLPVLDVTLRNDSQSVVVVTQARVSVLARWHVGPNWMQPDAMPASYKYDLGIPGRSGASIRIPLSQELRPQTADRFQLILGPAREGEWYPALGLFIHFLKIELEYNESKAVVKLPSVFTHIPPPWEVVASFNPGATSEEFNAVLKEARAAKAQSVNADLVEPLTISVLDQYIKELRAALKENSAN